MMKKNKDSRRTFIKKTAVGAIGMAAFSARSYANIIGANDKVQMAVVGLNGRGQAHIRAIVNTKNTGIIAVCDVDSRLVAKSAETVKTWTGTSPESMGKILWDNIC